MPVTRMRSDADDSASDPGEDRGCRTRSGALVAWSLEPDEDEEGDDVTTIIGDVDDEEP